MQFAPDRRVSFWDTLYLHVFETVMPGALNHVTIMRKNKSYSQLKSNKNGGINENIKSFIIGLTFLNQSLD